MPQPRILFGGGGGEEASRPLDERFAQWLGPQARLLYLPTALVDPLSMQAGFRWAKSVFFPLGLTQMETWEDLAHKTARDLAAFDGVYINGGNTFYLLHQLRLYHLDGLLADFIQTGKPVYGGSAGAIILGKDITPCAHIDEDIVGLDNLAGLDLALGWAIWCHYQEADAARVQQYVTQSGVPALALTERAGLYREGDTLYAAGYDPVRVFAENVVRVVPAKEAVTVI